MELVASFCPFTDRGPFPHRGRGGNGPDARSTNSIQDAERLRELLWRNRQQAEREVQLRVPFTVILKAIDQLEASELRLLVQRLEDRLAAVQS